MNPLTMLSSSFEGARAGGAWEVVLGLLVERMGPARDRDVGSMIKRILHIYVRSGV